MQTILVCRRKKKGVVLWEAVCTLWLLPCCSAAESFLWRSWLDGPRRQGLSLIRLNLVDPIQFRPHLGAGRVEGILLRPSIALVSVEILLALTQAISNNTALWD